jgi:hypothetical protein
MGTRTKHILIFSLSLVTLVSCGGGSSNKGKAIPGVIGTQELEEAVLTTTERSIATRICIAYRTKGVNFRTTQFIGGTYQYNGSNQNCSNQKSEYTVNTTLRYDANNNLEFFNPDTSKPIVSIVQTDTTGFLSQLCTKIFNNEEISNTTFVGARKVQVEFFRKDLDSYTFRTFVANNNETASVFESADTFQVRTQSNVSGEQIVGMDEIISSQRVCPKPSVTTNATVTFPEFSLITQTYVKRVTTAK